MAEEVEWLRRRGAMVLVSLEAVILLLESDMMEMGRLEVVFVKTRASLYIEIDLISISILWAAVRKQILVRRRNPF